MTLHETLVQETYMREKNDPCMCSFMSVSNDDDDDDDTFSAY
jgi:hypothetical protein